MGLLEVNITAITLTGSRPEAFELCERYLTRQTLRPSRWIVVDDGREWMDMSCGQEVIRLPPIEGISLNRNLAAALSVCSHYDEVIFIIEDDEWYHKDYIATVAPYLERNLVAGEGYAKYYSVTRRRWFPHGNIHHASFCQTAFRFEVLDVLDELCGTGNPYLDLPLWRHPRCFCRSHLIMDRQNNPLVVGIKGMPGRKGIGLGHDKMWAMSNGVADPDLVQLRAWIGADADNYSAYFEKD